MYGGKGAGKGGGVVRSRGWDNSTQLSLPTSSPRVASGVKASPQASQARDTKCYVFFFLQADVTMAINRCFVTMQAADCNSIAY